MERIPQNGIEISLVNLDLAVTTGGNERINEQFAKLLSKKEFLIIENIPLENGQKILLIKSR